MATYFYGALTIWYILTAGSLIFLLYDVSTNTPMLGVMKLAWILILLYMGPIGLFLYFMSCRQPLPGTHDQFIAAHWKQSVGSLMHCVAGDATGIILAASIVYPFGLPNGVDLMIEYSTAFVVGLLVFQALFMMSMFGSYWTAVRKTFFAEFVSMNMVMVGMIPVMLLVMHHVPHGNNPTRPFFWAIMSLATMAGAITAYPINSWMVRRGLKHGMMSKPGASTDKKSDSSAPMHMHHDMSGQSMDHEKMSMDMPDHSKSPEDQSTHQDHQTKSISSAQAWGVILLTLAILALVVWITSLFVPIRLA